MQPCCPCSRDLNWTGKELTIRGNIVVYLPYLTYNTRIKKKMFQCAALNPTFHTWSSTLSTNSILICWLSFQWQRHLKRHSYLPVYNATFVKTPSSQTNFCYIESDSLLREFLTTQHLEHGTSWHVLHRKVQSFPQTNCYHHEHITHGSKQLHSFFSF
jgi:hypothetical protein